MSWSVSTEGTKDELTAGLDERFAGEQARYPIGTLEGDDIASAKARCAAFVAAYVGDKRLSIVAHGSHSFDGTNTTSASFAVTFGVRS